MATMEGIREGARSYIDAFAKAKNGLASGRRAWTATLREQAMARFEERGFPPTKVDAWRYTSVAPIVRTPFRADVPGDPAALTRELVERLRPRAKWSSS